MINISNFNSNLMQINTNQVEVRESGVVKILLVQFKFKFVEGIKIGFISNIFSSEVTQNW